jgi:uncharacterized protein YecT (DUF1311 family)
VTPRLSCVGFAIVMLAGQATATEKKVAPPREIAGTWDVEQVVVDGQDQLHWEVKPNDPQLMGRTMVIETGLVQFDDGKEIKCKSTGWPRRSTSWSFLVGKGFPRPPMGGRSRAPTPDDFGLKKRTSQKVTAYSLCSGPAGKVGTFPTDAWVVVESPDRLALHYDNQVLLLLRRRPPDAKPTPSFSCVKAVSPTEKAICGSFELASWDRSVALAFQQALDRLTPEKQSILRRAQEDWLKSRDACEDKVDCIDERLWRRVEDLVQE